MEAGFQGTVCLCRDREWQVIFSEWSMSNILNYAEVTGDADADDATLIFMGTLKCPLCGPVYPPAHGIKRRPHQNYLPTRSLGALWWF